jgi:hypothetical protein
MAYSYCVLLLCPHTLGGAKGLTHENCTSKTYLLPKELSAKYHHLAGLNSICECVCGETFIPLQLMSQFAFTRELDTMGYTCNPSHLGNRGTQIEVRSQLRQSWYENLSAKQTKSKGTGGMAQR